MSDDMLGAALLYARIGWKVFPLHSPRGETCSCGKTSCESPGKHPRTRGGFKDGTTDPSEIERWWARWPDANIGLATGDGLIVIDVDGPDGAAEFKMLVDTHERVPQTLTAATGNGLHLVFNERPGAPEVRSSARGKVHVRGSGGYIVAAPSKHISGRNYRWVRMAPVAELPDWLRQWTQGYEVSAAPKQVLNLGPLPDYLKQKQPNVGTKLDDALRTPWNMAEQSRLASALSSIPANAYEIWFQCGMALKDLGWERSDGSDIGFDIWVAWSETCSEKFSLHVCEEKWRSFRRSGVTLGTIYHLAREHGWSGGAPEVIAPQKMNGNHAEAALPAAFLSPPQRIFFPDRTEEGHPKATYTNAIVAVEALGIACEHDLFHNRMLVAGELLREWSDAELTDNIVMVIRSLIRHRFGFDPNKQNTADACQFLCLKNQFDPVLDYLDELHWDGRPRLDSWLTRYLGAADTDLTRAIAKLSLIAAVRRARHPGTKFDQIIVLEGPEGKGKSEALEILAGKANFSDQKIMGVDDRMQQELLEGVWIYEIADLTGMRKAEIEAVKAFASRTTDRARPAYGRFRVDRPRRAVIFGTTNRDDYLISETGNRRFWPVTTAAIDVTALRRDRDQLWAEASVREARGESHVLPERLWGAAGEEQARRLESDEWLERISNYLNMTDKVKTDVSIMDVLCDNQFIQMRPDAIKRGDAMRAGAILKRLNFFRYHKRIENGFIWRYRRGG